MSNMKMLKWKNVEIYVYFFAFRALLSHQAQVWSVKEEKMQLHCVAAQDQTQKLPHSKTFLVVGKQWLVDASNAILSATISSNIVKIVTK
jgi:hypothetical protein